MELGGDDDDDDEDDSEVPQFREEIVREFQFDIDALSDHLELSRSAVHYFVRLKPGYIPLPSAWAALPEEGEEEEEGEDDAARKDAFLTAFNELKPYLRYGKVAKDPLVELGKILGALDCPEGSDENGLVETLLFIQIACLYSLTIEEKIQFPLWISSMV